MAGIQIFDYFHFYGDVRETRKEFAEMDPVFRSRSVRQDRREQALEAVADAAKVVVRSSIAPTFYDALERLREALRELEEA